MREIESQEGVNALNVFLTLCDIFVFTAHVEEYRMRHTNATQA
jgi:hypothetical protein